MEINASVKKHKWRKEDLMALFWTPISWPVFDQKISKVVEQSSTESVVTGHFQVCNSGKYRFSAEYDRSLDAIELVIFHPSKLKCTFQIYIIDNEDHHTITVEYDIKNNSKSGVHQEEFRQIAKCTMDIFIMIIDKLNDC